MQEEQCVYMYVFVVLKIRRQLSYSLSFFFSHSRLDAAAISYADWKVSCYVYSPHGQDKRRLNSNNSIAREEKENSKWYIST